MVRLAVYIFLLITCIAAASPAQAQRRAKGKRVTRVVSQKKGGAMVAADETVAPDPETMKLPDKLPTDVPIPKGTMPVVQKVENGQVNWGAQYIEATGESVLDTDRFKNIAQARAMATRGATVVAQRNLLEIVKGVNVTSQTTVEDLITTKDFIVTRIEGVVKGAQMVGGPIEKDGTVTVRLRMPIYAENGLAPAVYDQLPPAQQADTSAYARKGLDDGQSGAGKPTQAPKGIAFNLNGKSFDPTMFPTVTDSAGRVLIDFKQLYDPSTGKFPQYLQASKEILGQLGIKKGVELLNVIDAKNGTIRLDEASAAKFPWAKVINTVKKIGKLLLLFL